MHKIKIKSITIFVKCSKTYTSNSSDYLHRELATHSTLWAWTNCIHLDQILYYKRSRVLCKPAQCSYRDGIIFINLNEVQLVFRSQYYFASIFYSTALCFSYNSFCFLSCILLCVACAFVICLIKYLLTYLLRS